MDEHWLALDRAHKLERANRRWKTACAVLAAALLGALTSSAAWVGINNRQLARSQAALWAAEDAATAARAAADMQRAQTAAYRRRAEQLAEELRQGAQGKGEPK